MGVLFAREGTYCFTAVAQGVGVGSGSAAAAGSALWLGVRDTWGGRQHTAPAWRQAAGNDRWGTRGMKQGNSIRVETHRHTAYPPAPSPLT